MTSNSSTPFTVRAVHCDHQSSDEKVYEALRRATEPLESAWDRLRSARRIAIKFNQDWVKEKLVLYQGHRQQLVSDPVARAVLRLLRERTSAELFVIDIGVEGIWAGVKDGSSTHILPVLREFDVPFVDGSQEEVEWVNVPGGGQMFERYPLPKRLLEADAVISVQKMKNHLFTGVTLCMKNLFGLMSMEPAGRPRHYYHHLVRLPYMLADLGKILQPTLNILDGLVTQAGMEWGVGDHPVIANTIIAGDQVVATDACAASLMGHDPAADWLTPPYHRDRNPLLVAAQGGLGTVNLEEIDFRSEVKAPIGAYFALELDPRDKVISWRRSAAEQALYYLAHRDEIIEKYAGNYILQQMGEVKYADPQGIIRVSRRVLAGDHPEQALYFKYVEAQESEGEHFEVYRRTLEDMRSRGL